MGGFGWFWQNIHFNEFPFIVLLVFLFLFISIQISSKKRALLRESLNFKENLEQVSREKGTECVQLKVFMGEHNTIQALRLSYN